MNDEETHEDDEAQQVLIHLAELGRRFARPRHEKEDAHTPEQLEIYETVGGVAAAMGRLDDPSPPRETFPTRGKPPRFRDKDPVEPRAVRRGDVVTLHGENLYGIGSVVVGGRRARIVRRGLDRAQILVPEGAVSGSVKLDGVVVTELELELIDDDSNNYGSVT